MTHPDKTVTIRYFAQLKDEAGKNEEVIQTQSQTLLDLYNELRQQYSFTLSPDHLKVALNDEFSCWDQMLSENAKVVFIPPVAGG